MFFIRSIVAILFVCIVFSFTNENKEFRVSSYGAVGDGVTDDGAAVRKAVAAAIQAGKGSKVVFDNKTYRLDKFEGDNYQINFKDVSGISIEGHGAELINNPYNSKDIHLEDYTFYTAKYGMTHGSQ